MEQRGSAMDQHMDAMDRIFSCQSPADRQRGETVARWMLQLAWSIRAHGLYPDCWELSDEALELLPEAAKWYDLGLSGLGEDPAPEEQNLYRTHPQRAMALMELLCSDRDLTAREDMLWAMAIDCAMEHHERWDGGGFPHRLKGEGIRLLGRMCALCDCFYRLCRDLGNSMRARQALLQGSGTAFDPTLVTIFLQLLPELSGPSPPPGALGES